jgi:mannose-6-phosphate isomerase-like protein (cupin superfamily)
MKILHFINKYKMSKIIFTLIFLFVYNIMFAQTNLDNLLPPANYENIHVEKIQSNKDMSTFIIWIKNEVKTHYHLSHTENIYVLEGTANMLLGKDTILIQKGDFINILPQTLHYVKVTSKEPLKVISIQSPEFSGNDRHFIDDSY